MSLENQREDYSVLDKKGMYLIKYEENTRLSAPKMRGIVENTRKTMCNQTIRRVLLSMTFMVENSKKDLSCVEKTMKIGFDLQKNIWIRIRNLGNT